MKKFLVIALLFAGTALKSADGELDIDTAYNKPADGELDIDAAYNEPSVESEENMVERSSTGDVPESNISSGENDELNLDDVINTPVNKPPKTMQGTSAGTSDVSDVEENVAENTEDQNKSSERGLNFYASGNRADEPSQGENGDTFFKRLRKYRRKKISTLNGSDEETAYQNWKSNTMKDAIKAAKEKEIDKLTQVEEDREDWFKGRISRKEAMKQAVNVMSPDDLVREYSKYTSKQGKKMNTAADTNVSKVDPKADPGEQFYDDGAGGEYSDYLPRHQWPSKGDDTLVEEKQKKYSDRDEAFNALFDEKRVKMGKEVDKKLRKEYKKPQKSTLNSADNNSNEKQYYEYPYTESYKQSENYDGW